MEYFLLDCNFTVALQSYSCEANLGTQPTDEREKPVNGTAKPTSTSSYVVAAVAFLTALSCAAMQAMLSYAPALTTEEPVFAGVVGVAIPAVLTMCAFAAGLVVRS